MRSTIFGKFAMNFKALQEHGIVSIWTAGKIHIECTVSRPGLLTWPKFKDIPMNTWVQTLQFGSHREILMLTELWLSQQG